MNRRRKHITELSVVFAVLVLAILTMYPRFLAVQLKSKIETRQRELQQLVDTLMAYDLEHVNFNVVEDPNNWIINSQLIYRWGSSGLYTKLGNMKVEFGEIYDFGWKKSGYYLPSYPIYISRFETWKTDQFEPPNHIFDRKFQWFATSQIPTRDSDKELYLFLQIPDKYMNDFRYLRDNSYCFSNGIQSAGAILVWSTQFIQIATPIIETPHPTPIEN